MALAKKLESSPSKAPDHLPKISIVIPTYQQGRFLEGNLESLLNQNYPNLEIILMDGGSKDESVSVIKKYEKHIAHWVSEPDGGQSDAIQKGLARATGTWWNWLNGDDLLLPGALHSLAEIAAKCPEAKVITGARVWISNSGAYVRSHLPWQEMPWTIYTNWLLRLPQECSFIRLDWMREKGIGVRKELHNVMDTELYTRIGNLTEPVYTTAVFGAMKLHADQKGRNTENLDKELELAVNPRLKESRWWLRFLRRNIWRRWGIGWSLRLLMRIGIQQGWVRSPQIVSYCPEAQEWQLKQLKDLGPWV